MNVCPASGSPPRHLKVDLIGAVTVGNSQNLWEDIYFLDVYLDYPDNPEKIIGSQVDLVVCCSGGIENSRICIHKLYITSSGAFVPESGSSVHFPSRTSRQSSLQSISSNLWALLPSVNGSRSDQNLMWLQVFFPPGLKTCTYTLMSL